MRGARRRKSSAENDGCPRNLDRLDKPQPCSTGRSGTDLCAMGESASTARHCGSSRSRRASLRRVSQLALSATRSGVERIEAVRDCDDLTPDQAGNDRKSQQHSKSEPPQNNRDDSGTARWLGTIGVHDTVLEHHAEKWTRFFADAALQVAPNTAPA